MIQGDIVERRRKSAAATRSEMLRAARRRFSSESYENVGLRDIARDVGVDVALVSRYFGSKEGLFREVLESGEKPAITPPTGTLPDYFVSLLGEKDASADGEHIEKLLIILRSASSPVAAQIVREAVRSDVLEPLAALLPGEQADMRASMVLAIMLGTTILRTIMPVEPLCEGCPEAMRARLAGLFEAAIAAPLTSDAIKACAAAE
jgi:AcrR family transcriptional regulator